MIVLFLYINMSTVTSRENREFQDNTVNDNEHDDDNIKFCLFDSLQSASEWGIGRSADNKQQRLKPDTHTS